MPALQPVPQTQILTLLAAKGILQKPWNMKIIKLDIFSIQSRMLSSLFLDL